MILVTPDCPFCGHPPAMVFGGGSQAFCGNEDCTLLKWDPSLSLDENLLDAKMINLQTGEGGCAQ